MILNDFKEALISETAESLEWTEGDGSNKERTILHTKLYTDLYRNVLYTDVVYYYDGALFIHFNVGTISYNNDILKLVNAFNIRSAFVKATVEEENGEHTLLITYSCIGVTNPNDAKEHVLNALSYVGSQKCSKLIAALDVLVD